MGTQEEEAAALAELERVRTENMLKEMQRQEELRKLQEQQQNKMDGVEPAAVGWPDNDVQSYAPTGIGKVAGALGVGRAGDVAFARDLLTGGQPPLGSVSTSGQTADGARGNAAPDRGAKPALGLG